MLLRDPREISIQLVEQVADLCRRAGRPTSEGEVRLALARLGSSHDPDLSALARRKPPASPLSPHAVVDIVLGMPPEQASALEEAGAYLALAREAAEAAVELQTRPAPPAPAPKATTPRKKREKAGPPAPILRPRREVEARKTQPPPPEEEPAPPPPRPGRRPAAPTFGRFVEGPKAKRPFSELEDPAGQAILEELVVEVRGNPAALGARLADTWASPSGRFDEEVVGRLLAHHGLEALRTKQERDNLRGLLRRHRGFVRPVARALDMHPAQLRDLMSAYGLEADAEEQRRRTKEEALAETSLRGRLQLVLRQEDRLRDLRILHHIERQAAHELRDLVAGGPVPEGFDAPEPLLEWIRRDLGIDRAGWEQAVERFDLLWVAARRLGLAPSRPRGFGPRDFGPRGFDRGPGPGRRGPPPRGRPHGPGGRDRPPGRGPRGPRRDDS